MGPRQGDLGGAGDLPGSSLSLAPECVAWIEDGDLEVRLIESVRLILVGSVTFPAYRATSVAVRSEDIDAIQGEHDERQQEREAASPVAIDVDFRRADLVAGDRC